MATGIGPGVYGDQCSAVMKEVKASGVILMVVGGIKGSGFSIATVEPGFEMALPKLLRQMADKIETTLLESQTEAPNN